MMKDWFNKKNIIIYLSGCLTVGIVLAVIFFSFTKSSSQKEPTTKQLWGEKITVSDFKYDGKDVKFKIESEGAGAAVTTIPKINIPEYTAWKTKNNIIIASIISNIYDIKKPGFELSYLRRFGQFGIGAGAGYCSGVFFKISGMFMF